MTEVAKKNLSNMTDAELAAELSERKAAAAAKDQLAREAEAQKIAAKVIPSVVAAMKASKIELGKETCLVVAFNGTDVVAQVATAVTGKPGMFITPHSSAGGWFGSIIADFTSKSFFGRRHYTAKK
jgi:hypothetical protein